MGALFYTIHIIRNFNYKDSTSFFAIVHLVSLFYSIDVLYARTFSSSSSCFASLSYLTLVAFSRSCDIWTGNLLGADNYIAHMGTG